MKNREYQGIKLSKKESELVEFIQSGSNEWIDAYYIYKGRRNKGMQDPRKHRSWFNKTLAAIKKRGIGENIPFIYDGLAWMNPGVVGSKAGFVALTIQDNFRENKELIKKII